MNGIDWLFDISHEHDLIGRLFVHPGEAEEAVQLLDPEDFYDPRAKAAFEAIGHLVLEDDEVSLLTVATLAQGKVESADLMEWMGTMVFAGSIDTLVERISDRAARRRLYSHLTDSLTAAQDQFTDTGSIVTSLQSGLERLGEAASGELHLVPTHEVAARAEAPAPWLIPGLMYEMDATMIVAGEGAGKTQLGRQIAICAEAGIHPFTRTSAGCRPRRVLTIDLENKPRAVAETVGKVVTAVRQELPDFRPQGPIWEMPRGINLLTAHDRRLFTQAIKRTRPDLVFLGPIYKSFRRPRDLTDEQAVDEVIQFLDDCRMKYNFGLWMENHAPHGPKGSRDLRPIGTSMWLRWPEYGRSFRVVDRRTIKVEQFRGDRSTVYWPEHLKTGVKGWPFTGEYTNRVDLQVYGFPHVPGQQALI